MTPPPPVVSGDVTSANPGACGFGAPFLCSGQQAAAWGPSTASIAVPGGGPAYSGGFQAPYVPDGATVGSLLQWYQLTPTVGRSLM